MLVEDVRTYLVATTSLGLTARTSGSGNLYVIPIPASAPDTAISVVEYASMPPTRAMGADLGAPVCENVRFQVMVRVPTTAWATGRQLAEDIYMNLDNLHSTEIGSTGPTRYLNVNALGSPTLLGMDGNGRYKFTCDFEARKERG